MFWKIVVVVLLLVAMTTLCSIMWLGLIEEWDATTPYFWVCGTCLILGIVLFPKSVGYERGQYVATIRRYFF